MLRLKPSLSNWATPLTWIGSFRALGRLLGFYRHNVHALSIAIQSNG